MKSRTIVGVFSLGLAAALALGFAPRQETRTAPQQETSPRASGGAENFAVDAVHSSVIFKISHMGVTNFYGRFNDLSGEYSIDAANPENSRFSFEVKTESVDSGNSRRDGHLKNPDFFNAAEFPTISFKSDSAKKTGENKFAVTGQLSMHGETHPINVDMQLFPAKQTRQGFKGGFEAAFTINRMKWGVGTNFPDEALGENVTIIVAVEGAKK